MVLNYYQYTDNSHRSQVEKGIFMDNVYYLGMDLGTASLGWSVTDPEYHILKKHGKSLWGVRLFDSASTAEKRRTFRTNRRRIDRRNWRIQVLQELFAEEISAVDPGFFLRMKESKYYPEDKRDMEGKCPELPYALFVDKDFTDKDYHKAFPTIYHLRKWLMETDKIPDIRLVYLAIHHMLKHRGHFLLSGDIGQIKKFESTFSTLIDNINKEELDWNLELDLHQIKDIEETLKNRNLTKLAKKTYLIKATGAKTRCEKAIFTLISGGIVKLSDILGNEELNEGEYSKISFVDGSYDKDIDAIASLLGEQFYIIESAKAVYDWSVLVDILGDSTSISDAKVRSYEKHKRDLAFLKKTIKENLSTEEYRKVFTDTNSKLNNYCTYIGMTKKNGKKVPVETAKCTQGDFYDFLKKNVLEYLPDGDTKSYLENEINCETFLPKQVDKENSVIPYQIHLFELKKILKNLEPKIPFIRENREKLIQLFEFKIPYYVGPLSGVNAGNKGKFSWAVRKSYDKIYPWNFEKIIDIEESAECFIRKMTNKCTYLAGEDVLPKESLLYNKFMVLNELNTIRVNGEKLSVELKQKIYTDVFCRYRKVTQERLKNYLICEGKAGRNVDITGIDGDFKSSLKSYHDFKEKLTDIKLSQHEKEQIILNITLFGADKKLLHQRLKKLFPQLKEGQLKAVCSLSYKGWGRLSKKFLEEITVSDPKTEEKLNIITALWTKNENIMQLLYGEYKFIKVVEEHNSGEMPSKLDYKTVEKLCVSPAVKRQIWQALQVVKEIKKCMGSDPKRVFIEVAREQQDSKRTESRRKRLLDLYKSCKEEEKEIVSQLENQENQDLRSDKLYLYYTQKGKCMYSGENINFEELWDNNKYDIDHIYPQCRTMDDSIDNRVLVKREENLAKGDHYPVNDKIQKKRSALWKSLLDGGFISRKKYERLVRKTPFDENDFTDFIERQIVETRQATKVVADILKQAFSESEIVYVKAGIVSKFRQDFKLVKVREMNDLHHAKDAYLNIVVGNSYFVKFTKNAAWYPKANPGKLYNLQEMFKPKEKGRAIYDIERDGDVAWRVGENGTIVTVKKMMSKNNILVTRRSYEVKGGLFDVTIKKKGTGQIPIKASDERLTDIEKYGGYNSITGTYFMLVKSKDKKGREIRSLEFVPLYLKENIERTVEDTLKYLKDVRELKDPEILIKRIKKDTLFEVDGFKMWISGRSGTQLLIKNANQLIISADDEKCLKKILKFIQRRKENKNLQIYKTDKITEKDLLHLYDTFLDKLQNTIYKKQLLAQRKVLEEKRENFIKLKIEEKCIVLSEILHMFQCQSGTANLKLIGGAVSAGKLVMNSNITKCKNIYIINQSPAGIFEKKIDLQKL